ncbi:deoxycytidylate deaminase-like isoform X2 [Argopecten irradians]|uniref:deoxycytidylate deaminase-like isoform X2 n=1 Tax=Argopecten irradians TaxID=31199 RepID=UPI0037113E3E
MAESGNQSTSKRRDYIDWKEYFMAIALVSAERSKDPVTQAGACIVNANNRIVGLGYNGFPDGSSGNDEAFPWGKGSDNREENKIPYVCHAVMNAIMNKMAVDIKGCTMYATLYPCNECTKLIIQSGIGKVIYYADRPDPASKKMLEWAGITTTKYKPERKIPLKIWNTDQEL